jgi:plasmid stabilization system protein ParE
VSRHRTSPTTSCATSIGPRPAWLTPRCNGKRDDLWRGLRSLRAHPYTVFYRLTNGAVEIVRVLHGRRNFPAIFAKEKR